MKIGLVLEGGAMRGMYTAAFLDAFIENNIEFDGVVGVSAGAIFGVNLLSKQKGRVLRYNKRFNREKDYMGFRNLLKEGNFFNTEYAYERVPRYLDPFDDETYQDSKTQFFAVVTNITTGKPEYIEVKRGFEQMDVLRASASMPFLSKPVYLDSELKGISEDASYYLDGGISDSIPFQWMASQGYDKIIVILTRDLSYRKGPMPRALINSFYPKYPKLRASLKSRHEVYNSSVQLLKHWEEDGRAFVIRPSTPIGIGRTESDPTKLQEVYDLGVLDVSNCLDDMLKYIAK